jgi:diacylglycerol O-acyltransferase / wax synthase
MRCGRKLTADKAGTIPALAARTSLACAQWWARWAMSPRVFTFNVSNVRGPADPVYVLGGRVRELYALSEIAKGHALRIAAVSSSDTLGIGPLADSRAVPDLPC